MGILKLFLGNSSSILEPSNTFTSQVFQHPSNNEPLTTRLLGRPHMQTLLSDPPQRNLQKLFSEALLRQELLKLYKASSSPVKNGGKHSADASLQRARREGSFTYQSIRSALLGNRGVFLCFLPVQGRTVFLFQGPGLTADRERTATAGCARCRWAEELRLL